MSAADASASSLVPSRPGMTDGQTRGTVTSGVFPDRDNVSFPDDEQARREQARQESDWARGTREDHPSNTSLYKNDFVKAQEA